MEHHVLSSEDELQSWLFRDGGLCAVYAEVFGEPPERQEWSQEAVTQLFGEYQRSGIVVVSFSQPLTPEELPRCTGFIAALPLRRSKIFGSNGVVTSTHETVQFEDTFFTSVGVAVDSCFYIADLGVSSTSRRKGVATSLLDSLHAALPSTNRSTILRVSASKEYAVSLYEKLGFTIVEGVHQEAMFHIQGLVDPQPVQKRIMIKVMTD